MTDPLRTDRSPAAGDVPDRERDARIEELLLIGLDHYFSGQYELAISVWTRLLFLDRGHARARAYIERARSAVSERQREGEELLHSGVAAFDRGDASAARRLLTSAVERGAASEEALSLLDRLNRLEQAGSQPVGPLVPRTASQARREIVSPARGAASSSRAAWIATGVVAGLAAAAAAAWLWSQGPEWLPLARSSAPAETVRRDDPVPVPSAAENRLLRARALHERGRLHDALAALNAIRQGDPLRPEADELRATIQRQLLAASRGTPSAAQEVRAPRR